MRRIAGLLTALVVVALGAACGEATGGAGAADVAVWSDGAGDGGAGTTLTRLRAEGTRIVDGDGQTVLLRGVNLGGWLYNETWITAAAYSVRARVYERALGRGWRSEIEAALLEVGRGDDEAWLDALGESLAARVGDEEAAAFVDALRPYVPDLEAASDLPLRAKLSERFGGSGRDDLLDRFQRAWIGEEDIAWLAAQGFTLVRVPIGYRSLVTGADVARPATLSWNERAFARIDDLLRWCEQYGLYAVIDIQESPGGHNDYSGEALLYEDPALQDLTVQLWEALSDRYHDRDVVAAYSLLAEPYGAPSVAARDAMYDRLVRAIRARDDDHLLVIHDGFFGMSTLPDPVAMGWEGVVYSTHFFEFDAASLEDYEFLLDYVYGPAFPDAQAAQDVPYFIGSFSTRFDEPWAYEAAALLVDWYEENGWSWALWSYKKVDEAVDIDLFDRPTSYGLRWARSDEIDRPDIFEDDEITLEAKLDAFATHPWPPNERLLEALLPQEDAP